MLLLLGTGQNPVRPSLQHRLRRVLMTSLFPFGTDVLFNSFTACHTVTLSLCQPSPVGVDIKEPPFKPCLCSRGHTPEDMPTGEGIPGFIDRIPVHPVAVPMKKGEHWVTDPLPLDR